MRRITLACLLLLAALPVAADIYRWTDEQGNVHFSDEPRQGADAYDPGEPTVVESLPTPAGAANGGDGERERPEAGTRYERFTFSAPQPEENLRGNPGRVTVSLTSTPGLAPEHRIRLTLDGEPVPGSPSNRPRFQLNGVERGTHRLRATIVDGEGRVLAEAGPLVFYMHRPSVNLPANPN